MGKGDIVLEEVRAFMKSRVILTATQLDFFTRLYSGPATALELASAIRLDLRAATRILDCLVTLGLLEKQNGSYSLTESGSRLSSTHPESMRPMVMHMNDLWNSWSRLTDVVQHGPESQAKPGLEMDEENRKAFIGAMHVVARTLSEDIASGYDLSGFQKLLDIGGGSGTYTIAFLKKNPAMRAVLFDLPNVIPLAEARMASEGLSGRVDFVRGDFYRDALPSGCDLALLSAIIHQNSPAENVTLYSKIHDALAPGGVLLIRDHIMDEERTHPPEGALFALNMLVNTRGGDTYTFDEVRDNLLAAGFVKPAVVRTGEHMDCLVEAVKPAQ
ncbi:MAG: methyltransferase [Syntrophobacteraceae bacterium]